MMIEIVLDGNDNNEFLNVERKVYCVEDFSGRTLDAYREQAREIIKLFAEEKIFIIRNNLPDISNNMLALALFIETYTYESKIDCIVFKVSDVAAASQAYRPFMALTTGIRYILQLLQESSRNIYRDIATLGYLGLKINQDYIHNKLLVTLPAASPVIYKHASNLSQALVVIGIMKTLILAQIPVHIEAEITITDENPPANADDIINQVVEFVSPWINAD